MERRTLLTALAAAPLAALASTANALGRRRRQCCDQSSSGDVHKGLDQPLLTLTPDPMGMPGMTMYKVKVTVKVKAINNLHVHEDVMSVQLRLFNYESSEEVAGFGTKTIPPPAGAMHGAGDYVYESPSYEVILVPTQQYYANVTTEIRKSDTDDSPPQTAN